MEENPEPFDDDRRIPIPPSINSDLWEKGNSIGSGAYGNVYVGRHRRTEKKCAIKEMRDLEDRYAQSLHQEIKILQRLKHHNIVKYYGSKIVESQISIYMEYVEPGSLKKYIGSRGLQETLVRNFTKQILLGLVYLHGQRVVHRDIKPDNLLVDSKNNVKLADFGLAKHLAQSAGNHSVEGTICYAAPEVIGKETYKSSGEAYAADIWSLGCVVIEMFMGTHPWPKCTNPYQVMFKVCFNNEDPAIPENLSLAGKDFLENCFMRDPAKRPSAATLLSHPFVNTQFDDGQNHEASNRAVDHYSCGFPLALKGIGCSLGGQRVDLWSTKEIKMIDIWGVGGIRKSTRTHPDILRNRGIRGRMIGGRIICSLGRGFFDDYEANDLHSQMVCHIFKRHYCLN